MTFARSQRPQPGLRPPCGARGHLADGVLRGGEPGRSCGPPLPAPTNHGRHADSQCGRRLDNGDRHRRGRKRPGRGTCGDAVILRQPIDGSPGGPLTVVDNHDGTYSATVSDTHTRTHVISGKINGQRSRTGTATFVFQPGAFDSLTVTNPGDQVAGTSFNLSLTALDQWQQRSRTTLLDVHRIWQQPKPEQRWSRLSARGQLLGRAK